MKISRKHNLQRNCKYPVPDTISNQCTQKVYQRWLHRKAVATRKRDRKRDNKSASVESYKKAIHAAVVRDGSIDAYTGLPLRWDLVSRWDNEPAEEGGRAYRREFGDLPTVDHTGNGLGAPDFRICSWRTNDAKNDLAYNEFVRLCEIVLKHRPKFMAVNKIGKHRQK